LKIAETIKINTQNIEQFPYKEFPYEPKKKKKDQDDKDKRKKANTIFLTKRFI